MTVFVTYRLADALPRAVQDVYATERRRLDRLFLLEPGDAEVRKAQARLLCDRVDRFLDGGAGSCALGRDPFARLVLGNLRHHDGTLYTLEAAVIMPNHVHALLALEFNFPFADGRLVVDEAVGVPVAFHAGDGAPVILEAAMERRERCHLPTMPVR